MFKGYKANRTMVFAKAHYMFSYTMFYNIKTNIFSSDVSSGNHQYRAPKKFIKSSWKLSPIEWLKRNTDVSRIAN